jgi:hypothetical protein
MKGARRVVAAVLHRHPIGHELVVSFEDNDADIIETQVDGVDVRGLEDRASSLQEVLLAKGWSRLTLS